MIKALKIGPCLRKLESFGKYLIILVVLGLLIYFSSDKITEFNKKMSQKYQSKADSQWDDDTGGNQWILLMYAELFSKNFNSFAFKEMSFYIILTIVILVGFGFLSYKNNQYDLEMEKLKKKQENEVHENKSNLSKKID